MKSERELYAKLHEIFKQPDNILSLMKIEDALFTLKQLKITRTQVLREWRKAGLAL